MTDLGTPATTAVGIGSARWRACRVASSSAAALLIAGVAGCDGRPAGVVTHETPLADGDTRVELEKDTQQGLREAMLGYRVRLVRAGVSVPVLDGATKLKSFSVPKAALLPGGRVVLFAHTILCVADAGAPPSCVELGDGSSGRSELSCIAAANAGARCRSVLDTPDEPLQAALGWFAKRAEMKPSLRLAAVVALARGGDVPPAIMGSVADLPPLLGEQDALSLDGALARARGEGSVVGSLRYELERRTTVTALVIARSCVPELAGDVAAARARLTSERPDIAVRIGKAEEACARLPRPAR